MECLCGKPRNVWTALVRLSKPHATHAGSDQISSTRSSRLPGRRQFRLFVLRLAEVTEHQVLLDSIHYQFERLRTIGEGDPYWLVQVYVFLFELRIVHH